MQASTPFDVPPGFEIRLVRSAAAAQRWRGKGYTPVECSFGGESVVDDLTMDHHGSLSHLEGVAVRAYRDHFGARRKKPKFVVTGFADEDATWAIAALAGILPHPSNAARFPAAPENMLARASRDFSQVAELINSVDIDPNQAITLQDTFWGQVVLTFRIQGMATCRDLLSWYAGVDRWRVITTSQPEVLIQASGEAQAVRLEAAMSARCEKFGKRVGVVDLSEFGPNSTIYQSWVQRLPVVVAFIGGPNGEGVCSFIVRNLKTARRLFGRTGLSGIYPKLLPAGCGGREIIGGSHRGFGVRWEDALNYGRQLAGLCKR